MLYTKGEEEEAVSISLTAARKFNTVVLWQKSLTMHIQCRKSEKIIYPVLLEALSALKDKVGFLFYYYYFCFVFSIFT